MSQPTVNPRDVLAEIQQRAEESRRTRIAQDTWPVRNSSLDVPKLVAALRAVLDIHKPESCGPRTICASCLDSYEDYVDYPCPEVDAIAKALGGAS